MAVSGTLRNIVIDTIYIEACMMDSVSFLVQSKLNIQLYTHTRERRNAISTHRVREEIDRWKIWSHNKSSSLVGNDIGIKDFNLGQGLGQVPKWDMSTALNDAIVPRAGRLAWGVRREATGVSLWMVVMGVQARLGTEQETEELGDPWGNEQLTHQLKYLTTVSWFKVHQTLGSNHTEVRRHTFR